MTVTGHHLLGERRTRSNFYSCACGQVWSVEIATDPASTAFYPSLQLWDEHAASVLCAAFNTHAGKDTVLFTSLAAVPLAPFEPKHRLYHEMPEDATARVFYYRCTCGQMPPQGVTYEAFNIARGLRPWSTPRSIERAFQTHLREAAAASPPSSAPSTTE